MADSLEGPRLVSLDPVNYSSNEANLLRLFGVNSAAVKKVKCSRKNFQKEGKWKKSQKKEERLHFQKEKKLFDYWAKKGE